MESRGEAGLSLGAELGAVPLSWRGVGGVAPGGRQGPRSREGAERQGPWASPDRRGTSPSLRTTVRGGRQTQATLRQAVGGARAGARRATFRSVIGSRRRNDDCSRCAVTLHGSGGAGCVASSSDSATRSAMNSPSSSLARTRRSPSFPGAPATGSRATAAGVAAEPPAFRRSQSFRRSIDDASPCPKRHTQAAHSSTETSRRAMPGLRGPIGVAEVWSRERNMSRADSTLDAVGPVVTGQTCQAVLTSCAGGTA